MPSALRSRSCVVRLITESGKGVAARALMVAGLAIACAPGAAMARAFTYTHFPTDTTINSPVTTDFAIVGFAGGQYNEDTFAREFTGPSSPTVTVADGADIPDAEVFNSSVVNVTGGTIVASLYDSATLNVSGGTVPFLLGFDSAVITVTGGTLSDVEGQCQQVNVMSGAIGILVANTNTSSLGDILGSCLVNVTGGTFTGEINAFNDGILDLRGGSVLGASLTASEGGTFNIYGSGLAAQLLNPNAPGGYSLYSISGLLSDGSPLDGVQLRVRNDGVTYGHSTFNLINVPSPGLAGLMGLGGMVMGLRPRR